ncbi:hypothetical protein CCACVL1_11697 [Corchorus capsularis]|uniref:Uncharacterized protein n=1 Tax=Corchorus capsularis TaxID=210143 RepID=A0A1R3IK03_COCAP|nr:hypothetical protein CCACVL1_11697 [Corchorus capsularis]
MDSILCDIDEELKRRVEKKKKKN